jgi:hypothetical protein
VLFADICYRAGGAEIWKGAEGRSLRVCKGIAEIYIRFSLHDPPQYSTTGLLDFFQHAFDQGKYI